MNRWCCDSRELSILTIFPRTHLLHMCVFLHITNRIEFLFCNFSLESRQCASLNFYLNLASRSNCHLLFGIYFYERIDRITLKSFWSELFFFWSAQKRVASKKHMKNEFNSKCQILSRMFRFQRISSETKRIFSKHRDYSLFTWTSFFGAHLMKKYKCEKDRDASYNFNT